MPKVHICLLTILKNVLYSFKNDFVQFATALNSGGCAIVKDFISAHYLEFVFIGRVAYAGFLGILFGIERMLREKDAGIRTHFIVAVGACLMMLISKYGFDDMGLRPADPSRIASQIVSGVGFLGAGLIVYQRESLHGLTSAAGIWLTAGVGMAVGSGMYIVPTVACVLVLGVLVFLNHKIKLLAAHHVSIVAISFEYSKKAAERIKNILKVRSFYGLKLSENDGKVIAKATVRTNEECTDDLLAETMHDPAVLSINRISE